LDRPNQGFKLLSQNFDNRLPINLSGAAALGGFFGGFGSFRFASSDCLASLLGNSNCFG